MLSLYYSLKTVGKLGHTESLSYTAEHLGFGVDTVERAVSSFEENNEIVVEEGNERGGSCRDELDHDTEVRLAKKLQELNGSSSVATVDLQEWLKSEPDQNDEFDRNRVPVNVTSQTVGRWLKRMGYHFLEGNPGYTVTEERKARIREYLIDLSAAEAKERAGSHVLVYMDECSQAETLLVRARQDQHSIPCWRGENDDYCPRHHQGRPLGHGR